MLLSCVWVFTAVTPAVVGLWRLGNGCGALVDRLVHDSAPHPMKLHHHSGSLFFPLREGRSVQMHLECGGVPVHFVRENFRIVVFRLRITGAGAVSMALILKRALAHALTFRASSRGESACSCPSAQV